MFVNQFIYLDFFGVVANFDSLPFVSALPTDFLVLMVVVNTLE